MENKKDLLEKQSWFITCKMCFEPLREQGEVLEDFLYRMEQEMPFCSTRCADDWFGYDYE